MAAHVASPTNPLKQIVNIRRDELPESLLMFSYFFLIITTFWILRPLKTGLFAEFYDESGFNLLGWQLNVAQALQVARVVHMLVAFVAATVFAFLSHWFRRQQLTYLFSTFIIICYVPFSFVLDAPGDGIVWSFYIFGDLYTTLMVATFFAFLNDSVEPNAAKRLYGLIGLGGVTGGAFGSTVVRAKIRDLSMAEWL